MGKRMAIGQGFGFVIAGAQTVDGATHMVASQCVRDIEINTEQGLYEQLYPTPPLETNIVAKLHGGGKHGDHMVQVQAEQGGYPEAWRRLFDLWVPPQFTDETRTQILTHYTFGGM